MKHTSLVLLSMLCASAPLFADQDQRIIPAGSLISCTIAEPKISSKTTAIGDPVLCQLSHSEHYGRSVLPYKSYLVGRFEDYKDPGHFVGKGWMQLKFDRMVVEPDTVIPVDARVVDVPGYHVDNQGRILGKGHEKRDIALWSIPVLWPVDLLMLPMRGPRPTLKEETHLTLKVMDDLAVPVTTGPQTDPYGLQHRQPIAQDDPPPLPEEEPAPETAYAAPQQPPPPQDDSQPQDYNYAPQVAPPPPVYAYGYTAPLPVYGYGYGGYAPYGGAYRAYGYGGSRYYGYRGYAGAPRGPRVGGYGYGGPSRGYAGGSRGSAGGYGGGRPGGAVMSARGGGGGYGGGGFRGGGGGGGHRR